MATASADIALTPDLQSLLAGLRWRIRLYIWLEGLSLAVIWLGLMFWISLGLDYLPVLVGASEMPAAARAVLLVATGGVLAYVLYRWIFSRAFVRLNDRSMALLLERRFQGFHDSLVTSVELADAPSHASTFSRELLGKTADEARAGVSAVRYLNVFRAGSLAWKIFAATLVALSMVAFYSANAAAFERAAERIYLLSNEPWPRSAYIEVVGIEVLRAAAPGEESPRSVTLEFGKSRVIKVAKGANVSLKVRAGQPPLAQVVPSACTVYYRTLRGDAGIRGERGSVTMSNYRDTTIPETGITKLKENDRGLVIVELRHDGPAADAGLQAKRDTIVKVDGQRIADVREFDELVKGRQGGDPLQLSVERAGKLREVELSVEAVDWRVFSFDNKPFKSVLATVEFDVVGHDYRASDYRLEVVDSPAVVETALDLTYPAYMVDQATSSHLPAVDQPYLPAGTFIPLGTQVTLKFKANKPLRQAEILDVDSGERTTIDIDAKAKDRLSFVHRIVALAGSTTLEISLLDVDNVTTERPFRIFLTAIEDQPPSVAVSLKGIGSSVTPDVLIPALGKVSDDYAVEKTWFDLQVSEAGDPRDIAIALGNGGAVEQQIDFRYERAQKTGLEIKPGDKLFLSVKASDKFNLPTENSPVGEPHVAAGERYQLDVVTPEELLAQLEVREVGLRRRFELIIEEMTQLRDSLLRVKASLTPGSAGGLEPEDLRTDDDAGGGQLTPDEAAKRAASFRELMAQRAINQSQKSTGEVLGVAAGFLDIREELINNRVDTEDRKNRLKEQIADPLNAICAGEFPQLDKDLASLERLLREGGVPLSPVAAAGPADQAIDQANLTLLKLEEVLAKMQDLETYNELLEIVRDLLKDQEKLIDRTRQEQKRQTLEELKKLE